MKNYYFLLLFILMGCENLNFSLVNQGTVVGDNVGNTSTADVDQHAGDRPLTPEEIKRAKEGYQRGKEEILNSQASLTLVESYFNIDWESDITRVAFFEKFEKKLTPVHRDLVTLLHLMYKKTPQFRLGQCERSIAQQRRNVAKGVSQTMNSRHTWSPVQACDIKSAREKRPWINGKADPHDVEFLGYMQGLAEGFGMVLSIFPCEAYASSTQPTFLWRSLRDLFHIQNDSKPGCKDGYKTKYNKF